MKNNWKKLATEAIDSLSPKEREKSIVYLEQRIIPAGEVLSWPGVQHRFDEPVVIAFVDLEPALNWTHRARYIVLNAQGAIFQTLNVDKPPFLSGVSPLLRVIHRGTEAPLWAAVAPDIEQ
ncbi:MAG: hypothetical protein PVF34_04590 [Gammaproteobacteria bacterium]